MRLIDSIVSTHNINEAIYRVKSNKGAAGIDKMTAEQVEIHFMLYKDSIIESILNKTYKPQPVRRVYIPKSNGKLRPLGIPTVVDRVIQQAISQKLVPIYEKVFSEYSYGFRPNRDCHKAIDKTLEYLNEGFEWVIDIDIEKYFDTVNHDKLISILREEVNDSHTLHIIRKFLQAGVMENGIVSATTVGTPQGGPLSPILSNIYLDKLDKELESRGLRFVRYADDCNIFVKSEVAANRVMKSITSWLERKLFLKVSLSKTKVVKPSDSSFLGFKYWKYKGAWKVVPGKDRKANLYKKCKKVLERNKAASIPLKYTFIKLNQIIRGWINYFKIGYMKLFMEKFGQWLRHKVRVVILKQWKNPKTIINNLSIINKNYKCNFSFEDIYKIGNSRLGLYAKANGNVINFILSPKVLGIANNKKERPGLVNPLEYYLR